MYKMKESNGLLVALASALVFAVALPSVSAQSESELTANVNQIQKATGYMSDLGGFAFGCSNQMSVSQDAMSECMAVINAFVTAMDEIWAEHEDTIDKYRMHGTSDQSDYLRGYLN